MKKIIILIIILVLIIITFLVFDFGRKNSAPLNTEVNASTTSSLPIELNIKDEQEISSPVKIEGKARGYWFFEGSFPIKLVSTNNEVLGTAIAQAEGDWMTVDFVNFTANLEYTKSTSTSRALLILSKDNPSDNRELDQEVYIPVILK